MPNNAPQISSTTPMNESEMSGEGTMRAAKNRSRIMTGARLWFKWAGSWFSLAPFWESNLYNNHLEEMGQYSAPHF